MILSGRRINDGMGKYVAAEIVKLMIKKDRKIKGARVLQLGITFKENCPDIRNSRAVDVVSGLQEFGCQVHVFDPWADPEEVKKEYGVTAFRKEEELSPEGYDAIVLAVAHREFLKLDTDSFKNGDAVVFDIKGLLPPEKIDGRL